MKTFLNLAILALTTAGFVTILAVSYPAPEKSNGNDHYAAWELSSRVMQAEWAEDHFEVLREHNIPRPPEIPAKKLESGYTTTDRLAMTNLIEQSLEGYHDQ